MVLSRSAMLRGNLQLNVLAKHVVFKNIILHFVADQVNIITLIPSGFYLMVLSIFFEIISCISVRSSLQP